MVPGHVVLVRNREGVSRMADYLVYVTSETQERRILQLERLVRKQSKQVNRLANACLLLTTMIFLVQYQVERLKEENKKNE